MNYFFDTSALVKLFHKEEGSDAAIALVASPNNHIWISELARLEFMSALCRRHRMGELTESNFNIALSAFEEQVRFLNVEPLGQTTMREAENLLMQYGKTVGLRSLDALHLASCLLLAEDDWAFVCADKTLEKSAMQTGLRVLNIAEPLEPSEETNSLNSAGPIQ